ncbi:unnamed protein product [Linum tenue]|uniref:Uncharacterized protein n=1 Tax=Linum tenue TaxID=586396 RepID=A0AAV0HI87_9ROSI|nr:unnamed protein product [Linum tenue]
MFPILVRVALRKKPAATSSSIWSLHRVLLLRPPPPSLTSSNHHYHHLKINLTSAETIKPSSPTPAELATFNFKLSLIDNIVPPIYVPLIFFFLPAPGSTGSKPAGERNFETLKSSLAQTLTRFYPLAGRLSKSVVHCNDEGVPFSSAAVDGDINDSSLADFLRSRIEIDSLQQFLPFPAEWISDLESVPQIAFRATAFPCGGLAIGVCSLHKIVDGPTLADFLKLWSTVARSHEKTAAAAVGGSAYAHNRAATSLLPLRHGDVPATAGDFVAQQGGKIRTRRLTFDEEAVHALKAKAKSVEIPDPTRTEAVAGFLWKCVMSAAARAASADGAKPRSVVSIGGMSVNLRSRMNEPWPDYSIGNMIWTAMSLYHNDHQKDSLDDGTKTLQELPATVADAAAKNESIIMPFTITSTIALRFYDVDFGWGKPAWVTMAQFPNLIPNLAVLLQSPGGYGAEVWLTLHEKEMVMLEQEVEFVTYAKNNMPVL